MSSSAEMAAEMLSDLYVERESGQWKTVSNCLNELCTEKVIAYPGLVSVALDLEEQDSLNYQRIMRRAKKLNDRKGSPGHLEARRLAQAALQIAVSHDEGSNLAAHVSRIGFKIPGDDVLANMVDAGTRLTKRAMRVLTRRHPEFRSPPDPPEIVDVIGAIKERDEYLQRELWRRDQLQATLLSCLAGQIDPWLAVDQFVGRHTRPYPYEFELTASQACFSTFAQAGVIEITKLQSPPDSLLTSDLIQFPLLSEFAKNSDAKVDACQGAAIKIPVQEFTFQILLELLFLRAGGQS